LDVVDVVRKRIADCSKAIVVGLGLLVKDMTKLFNLFANFCDAFLVEALVDAPNVVEGVKLVLNVLQPVDDVARLLSWRLLLVVDNVNVNVFCGLISIKRRRRWSR
jgi:hypothetical protein